VLSRLGLAAETESILATFPERWQWFPNGFGHYGPTEAMLLECRQRFLQRQVVDASCPQETFPLEMWPFRHMGLEPLGVLSTAVTESLLQSHDGVIRVFPARRGDAAFTLHAVGGTKVSAEMKGGTPAFVALENLHGGKAQVGNPWETAAAYSKHGELLRCVTDARTIELDFPGSDTYVLLPGDCEWGDFGATTLRFDRNSEPKRSANGLATLGMPRMF
jgi:hypothetical protein